MEKQKNPNHRSLLLPFVFRSFLSTLRSPRPLSSQPPMPHPTLLLRRTSQGSKICALKGSRNATFLIFLGREDLRRNFRGKLHVVIGFDHRKSVLSKILSDYDYSGNLTFHVDLEKSSSTAVYEYFSTKLSEMKYGDWQCQKLLNPKDRDCVELVFKYVEDVDLRRWIFPNIKAFNIGLGEWRSMLNCITNPHMYEQDAAKKLLDKVFKVRLGRGFYGDCLGVRADGNSNLSDEIGKELSIKSAAAGLRPIGAIVYMQRNNLKMCLRSTDTATDTSEVAKIG
ncbi:unnamed protein product [Camellia sinensis]